MPGPSTSLHTLVVAIQPDGHLAGSSFLGDSVSLCVVGSVASPPKRPHEVHGFPSLCPLLESVPPPKTCSIHWVCLTSIFLQPFHEVLHSLGCGGPGNKSPERGGAQLTWPASALRLCAWLFHPLPSQVTSKGFCSNGRSLREQGWNTLSPPQR